MIKKWQLQTLIPVIIILFGVMIIYHFNTQGKSSKKPMYWIDAMEPTIHYSGPGKSRMGMELTPVYANGNKQTPVIQISSEVVDNLGVRTAPVMESTLARQIDTVGYIDANEGAIQYVTTYVEGWVKKLIVKTSQEHVEAGQLLLQFYSPTIVNAQEEYLIALDSRNNDLITASNQRLQALGVSEKQIQQLKTTRKVSRLIDIYATQSGIVSQLNVREGMWVAPATEMMRLTNLSTIWIMIEIYENQAAWVAKGQTAEARLTSFPGKVWKGRVDYVYPQIDPRTRTLKARLVFDNPNEILKPGMYANCSVFAQSVSNALSIPQEALIRTDQGDRVIVSLGDGRFEPRKVVAGFESGDRIEITSGLQRDEKVVTSAQFLIDSEANLTGALQRLSSPITTPANVKQNKGKN